MSARTLFLAWREPESRRSYPIGRLDADGDPESYRFRYTRGALRAEREAGLPRTIEFPCADKEYRSSGLFPMFGNRVISPRRPDRAEQLRELGLGENADPIDILSANEGLRVTDAYRVFPKLVKKDGGEFACRFFLHGWRRLAPAARRRVEALQAGEELRIEIEAENPGAGRDAGLVTEDLRTVGWAPRWLAEEAAAALRETGDCAARIVRINPLPRRRRNASWSKCADAGGITNRCRARTSSRWSGIDGVRLTATASPAGVPAALAFAAAMRYRRRTQRVEGMAMTFTPPPPPRPA